MQKTLVVIGGGAAGFFCAANAAAMQPDLKVIIIEKSSKLLSKVKVSGGGRCNVTHACDSVTELVKSYPRGGNFLKKIFNKFSVVQTISWFEQRGVKLKVEEDGRMFPITDTSQTIIDCLMQEINRFRVEIRMNREVKQLWKDDTKWSLVFSNDETMVADYVCIACGGYPKSSMFEWIRQAGHSIAEPVPSLFTFNMPGNSITALMGVVVEKTQVKLPGTKLEQSGPLLITHWGMSGPVVLKLSAWGARELVQKNYSFQILVNWIPPYHENSAREQMQKLRFEVATQKLSNRNPFQLPNRLWLHLLAESGISEDIRWADLPAREQNKLAKNLCAQEYLVKGKTTFKEEFVTSGGVNLNEIDADTMMSKIAPGLFFAGEIINVDGVTGGYNFQNAWTTAYIAAEAIAVMSKAV